MPKAPKRGYIFTLTILSLNYEWGNLNAYKLFKKIMTKCWLGSLICPTQIQRHSKGRTNGRAKGHLWEILPVERNKSDISHTYENHVCKRYFYRTTEFKCNKKERDVFIELTWVRSRGKKEEGRRALVSWGHEGQGLLLLLLYPSGYTPGKWPLHPSERKVTLPTRDSPKNMPSTIWIIEFYQ